MDIIINTTMDEKDDKQPDNLFDSLGLEVKFGDVEVGQTYPIYGMITDIISDTPGDVIVMVNYNIEMRMNVEDAEKLALLKRKCFEPGIFVCAISHTEPSVKGDCVTVVFGKSSTSEMH